MDDINPDIEDNETKNKTFYDVSINSQILINVLEELNYRQPSPIQYKSIPLGIQGRNLIAQSKAGTGKTIAYLSILFNKLLQLDYVSINQLLALIILPTRELALQVFEIVQKITKKLTEQSKQTQKKSISNKIPQQNILTTSQDQLKAGILIGGLPIEDDRKNIKINKIKIAIGTLGRINALQKENTLQLQNIQILVLDEADQLINQNNFFKDLTNIITKIPKQTQILAYSATFPQDAYTKLFQIMNQPHFVSVIQNNLKLNQEHDQTNTQIQNEETFNQTNLVFNNEQQSINQYQQNIQPTTQTINNLTQQSQKEEGEVQSDITKNTKDTIKQDLHLNNLIQLFHLVEFDDNISIYRQKIALTVKCLTQIHYQQCIIFYNDKARGENLYNDLRAENLAPIFIHGDQSQADRIRIMNQMRRNKINIIIATDLLSRGIDIQEIDLVINFDAPQTQETYFHRIGRTGRFGKAGVSIILLSDINQQFILQNGQIDLQHIQKIPLDFTEINQKLDKKKEDLKQQKGKQQKQKQQKEYGTAFAVQFSEWHEVDQQLYDQTNFKYYQEEQQNNKNLLEQNSQQKTLKSNKKKKVDIKKKKLNSIIDQQKNQEIIQDINQHQHCKCIQEDQFSFLKCKICYEFLQSSKEMFGKQFEILKYFKLDEK